MPLQFTVLASGSSGNACLLQVDGFGILLDAGLGPRTLKQRLETVGASWNHVHVVLLTHTHSDHWRETTFTHLHRQQIPLHCHAGHHEGLLTYSPSFAKMREVNLVREYATQEFVLAPGLRCRPLPLCHDCGHTFGFRFDYFDGASGSAYALAYVADLGSWDRELVELLADVDLLALEFNHDVELEQNSGRSPDLIEHILGDDGHLSNTQAAALLAEILRRSPAGRLRHLVQLHLSRDCNRPELARAAARAILADHLAVNLHTACQDEVGPTLIIGPHLNGTADAPLNRPVAHRVMTSDLSRSVQPLLPGMEE